MAFIFEVHFLKATIWKCFFKYIFSFLPKGIFDIKIPLIFSMSKKKNTKFGGGEK
jgi:hypothetical protein